MSAILGVKDDEVFYRKEKKKSSRMRSKAFDVQPKFNK